MTGGQRRRDVLERERGLLDRLHPDDHRREAHELDVEDGFALTFRYPGRQVSFRTTASMTYLDQAVLNLTERLCRRFQALTGRTNVWLAFQLTNLSVIVYFVWVVNLYRVSG